MALKKNIKLYPAYKYVEEKEWEHLKEKGNGKYVELDRTITGEVKIGFFATLEAIAGSKYTFKAKGDEAEIIFNYL